LSKTKKLLLGAATVLPSIILLSTILLIAVFLLPNSICLKRYWEFEKRLAFLLISFLLAALTIGNCAIAAFYLKRIDKMESIPADKKKLWRRMILLTSSLSMPIFWYLHVWPEGKDSAES